MSPRSVTFHLHGQRMCVSGDHDFYLQTIDGADYSTDPLATLVAGLPPAATILDIGANIGVTSIILSRRRPDDTVFAFEPIPSTVALLRQNLAANGIGNCHVVATAVGDTVHTARMTSRGAWSMIRSTSEPAATVPVAMTTLDAFCAERLKDRRIDLIKIDVEGFEPNVLAGAARTIGRWRPIVFLEFNAWALVLQNVNPLSFATLLWRHFDVAGKNGARWESPERFTSDTMVRHQSIDDLVLTPRAEDPFDGPSLSIRQVAFQREFGAEQPIGRRQAIASRLAASLRGLKATVTGS